MNVNPICFTAKTPKIKIDRVKKGELPDFFRDKELKKKKKDKVTIDYFKYDIDDVPLAHNLKYEV